MGEKIAMMLRARRFSSVVALAILLLFQRSAEGQQYVPNSFLKNPPTDATAIKSWTFLKESMERMGDQAADLLTVRQDVSAMQEDVDTQVNLWRQAKMELLQENAGLKAEVAKMNLGVTSGAAVQVDVLKVQQEVLTAKGKLAEAKVTALQHQNDFASQRTTFQKRVQELTARLHAAQEAAQAEKTTEQVDHTALHNDGLALQSKAMELEMKLKDVEAAIAREQASADEKTHELEDLHAELTGNIEKLKKGVEAAGPLEKNMITMQAQLQEDTTEMVAARQHYSAVSMECKKKQSELTRVLAAEQESLKRAQEEAASYCGPVQGKNQAYKQALEQCHAADSAPVPAAQPPPPPP